MKGGALKGIKVVELATMVSGPYCGKLLADLGADVIKAEAPDGDPARQCGPFLKNKPHPERSALFLYNNTSKRGITLNLEMPAGRRALKGLIKWADILIDNHPPRWLEDLGLTWDVMRKLNPGLVYTCITPYGRTGPRANVKGDELTIIHAGGLGNLMPVRSFDVDRAPVKMGGYAVGYHSGLTAALATLGAILGRLKTGRGQLIDISLQEVILALMRVNVTGNRYHHLRWNRVPDRPPAMGRLKASDGYIVVGAIEDHHWRAFRELMGNPEWAAGSQWESLYYRTYHLMEIAPQIDEWALKQKKEVIHHEGAKKGIPMGPINSAKEVMENEQYAARGYFVEVEHPEAGKHKYAGWPYQMTASPPCVSRPAPLLGQHNQEVFRGILGYSPAELRRLQRSGAVLPHSGTGSTNRKGGK